MSDALQTIQKNTEAYLQGNEKAQSQSIEQKIAQMWRNHIVPYYLFKYGYSKVLGKGWEQYSTPLETMRMGYSKIPDSVKESINYILHTYFSENQHAVRVPREYWEDSIIG